MKGKISLDALRQAASQCVRRFPVALAFIAALTVYLLVRVWTDGYLISKQVDRTVYFYLTAGILLSSVLQLWGEEVKTRRTRLLTGIMAHVALLADAVYIWHIQDNGFRDELLWMWLSLVTSLILCMFVAPFFRERDDAASINFTSRLCTVALCSWAIGGVMWGGLCLLTVAIRSLFGIYVSENWITTWHVLFLVGLPSLVTVGCIPAGEMKHNRTLSASTFLQRSIHYLILPLLAGYLLVLYGYLFKVIVEFQLPDGWVSKLVTVLMFGCVGVVISLYTSLRQGNSATDKRMVRVLPLAILPLLVLMTVGTVRRFADYGITVNRLYLLMLLVWYYIVCVGLYLSRARRIWWIPASFSIMIFLTSALPVNVTRITRNWMRHKVEASIKDAYKGTLPMSEDDYHIWLTTLPAEEAQQINSRLEYLDINLHDTTIYALVSDSVNWWKADNMVQNKAENKPTEYIDYAGSLRWGRNYKVELADKHASMLVYAEVSSELPYREDSILRIPLLQGSQPVDTLDIPMSDLRRWDAIDDFSPRCLPCLHRGSCFVLTDFNLRRIEGDTTCNFTYSGYYFMQPITKNPSKQISDNE